LYIVERRAGSARVPPYSETSLGKSFSLSLVLQSEDFYFLNVLFNFLCWLKDEAIVG
jgi:hypothetical protein